jgi:hypothetical protein
VQHALFAHFSFARAHPQISEQYVDHNIYWSVCVCVCVRVCVRVCVTCLIHLWFFLRYHILKSPHQMQVRMCMYIYMCACACVFTTCLILQCLFCASTSLNHWTKHR